MKKFIVAILLGTATFAVAESTFIMVTGSGSSQNQLEATENAIAQATDNLSNQCGGSLRNVHQSITESHTGNWYYVTATVSAYCDK